ncbi:MULTISPECIES: sirohydrochlorin cobaltochelatase [Eubacteriales]|uniref:Sirohydrochlorin cobaltochelatase n=1 Tax=Bittarella massiliensis (ex Durand et al. 2017) TaxID=1720313 RepID=A0AAQ1MFU8_9FIRM|nr:MULTISPECIES: sirohydrochlorin cobaltochelatase [Eubacteriales]SHG66929.1 sirohydrochlorin cobaltochelatase [Bittarella massiliensis (ex Durand et al. 2017)]
MKKTILLAGFGTARWADYAPAAGALEGELATAFPGWSVRRAFASSRLAAALTEQGHPTPHLPAALAELAAEGGALAVLPTHLAAGGEYDDLAAQLSALRPRLPALAVARPLLSSGEDCTQVAQALLEGILLEEGEGLVLMAHGSRAAGMGPYRPLAAALPQQVALGAMVNGGPEAAGRQLLRAGYRRCALAPLLVCAGGHTRREMAGPGPDSWLSRLRGMGLAVRPVCRGLAELPALRALYRRHLAKALAAAGLDAV